MASGANGVASEVGLPAVSDKPAAKAGRRASAAVAKPKPTFETAKLAAFMNSLKGLSLDAMFYMLEISKEQLEELSKHPKLNAEHATRLQGIIQPPQFATEEQAATPGSEEGKTDGPESKTGPISVKYNHYGKDFTITDGVLKGVDFFSLAWANGAGTKLHLSLIEQKPDQGAVEYLKEEEVEKDPNLEHASGINYVGLVANKTYYVHVIMGDEEKKKLEEERKERQEQRLKEEEEAAKNGGGIATGYNFGGEDSASCSCLEGNPCASEYNCKNWADRYEIAKKNGWKGF